MLLIFYDADFQSKAVACAFVIFVAFATSFIRIPARGTRPRSQTATAEDVVDRADQALPARARIDSRRPLLAAKRAADGAPQVILIVFDETAAVEPILMVPWVKRGRGPVSTGYQTYAALREDVAKRELQILAQNDFSDEAGVILFGEEWRN